ncbi:unnamed protein product [Vitrella brassicaformis CCMP3155]|uniref:Uncharacterized protein n=2 Tax=Vitrella brassicaformis TaxID=1169539 RepID=A0A0G4FFH8_VITBC|nr:unnamed protein product [Vitrella brassicaformis CCMP3155]|eukprot:CEM11946.1 unnamed protein product [Vitrella brassicaformis CCMP3155]
MQENHHLKFFESIDLLTLLGSFLRFRDMLILLRLSKGLKQHDTDAFWKAFFAHKWAARCGLMDGTEVAERVKPTALSVARFLRSRKGGRKGSSAALCVPKADRPWKMASYINTVGQTCVPPLQLLRTCRLCSPPLLDICHDVTLYGSPLSLHLTFSGSMHPNQSLPSWIAPCSRCGDAMMVHRHCAERACHTSEVRARCQRHAPACEACQTPFQVTDRFPTCPYELCKETWRDRHWLLLRLMLIWLPLFALFTMLVAMVENLGADGRHEGRWKMPEVPILGFCAVISVLWWVFFSPRFRLAVRWWSAWTWNLYIALYILFLCSTAFFLLSFVHIPSMKAANADVGVGVRLSAAMPPSTPPTSPTEMGSCWEESGSSGPTRVLRGSAAIHQHRPLLGLTTSGRRERGGLATVVDGSLHQPNQTTVIDWFEVLHELHLLIRRHSFLRFLAGLNALLFVGGSFTVIGMFWLTSYRIRTVRDMQRRSLVHHIHLPVSALDTPPSHTPASPPRARRKKGTPARQPRPVQSQEPQRPSLHHSSPTTRIQEARPSTKDRQDQHHHQQQLHVPASQSAASDASSLSAGREEQSSIWQRGMGAFRRLQTTFVTPLMQGWFDVMDVPFEFVGSDNLNRTTLLTAQASPSTAGGPPSPTHRPTSPSRTSKTREQPRQQPRATNLSDASSETSASASSEGSLHEGYRTSTSTATAQQRSARRASARQARAPSPLQLSRERSLTYPSEQSGGREERERGRVCVRARGSSSRTSERRDEGDGWVKSDECPFCALGICLQNHLR